MKKKNRMESQDLLKEIYLKGSESTINLRPHKKEISLSAQQMLNNWEPLEKINNEYRFQVIDFFCGCGGMSLGFAALSRKYPFFKILGGCDIEANAAKTFEKNLNASGILTDLRTLVNDQNELNVFLDKLDGYDKDKPLIVIGCAPCQGFTSHRKKNWSTHDRRNSLITDFANVATELDPACIVMENVPEILSKKYWDYFVETKEILENSGYYVHQNIYNAASFGVPQERFRTIIIAMKKDFLLPEILLRPEEYITVRDAIGHLPKIKAGKQDSNDELHRSASHRKSTIDVIKKIPKDGGNRPPRVGPKCLDKINGFSDVYGRLSWSKPAITITRYARNPASGRYVHPEQNRGLTIREAALLQSFPIGFEFIGSLDAIFKQIGEAVPPKLSCAIASNVLVELLSPEADLNEKNESLKSIAEPVSSSYSSVIAGIKSKRKNNGIHMC